MKLSESNDLIQPDLLKDEEVLWFGKPTKIGFFVIGDVLMIPLSLFWGGVAIIWEFIAIFGTPEENSKAIDMFFPFFGIPLLAFGLYFIFGRFIYKKIKNKNTYYFVTDKRIIVLTKVMNKRIQAEYIETIPTIEKTVKTNGVGTIKFGNIPFVSSFLANTGVEFLASTGRNGLAFYGIEEVDKVYQLVNELRGSVTHR